MLILLALAGFSVAAALGAQAVTWGGTLVYASNTNSAVSRSGRPPLDAAGKPYGFLTFEDEGHCIHSPKNRRLLYRRLADCFSEALARS